MNENCDESDEDDDESSCDGRVQKGGDHRGRLRRQFVDERREGKHGWTSLIRRDFRTLASGVFPAPGSPKDGIGGTVDATRRGTAPNATSVDATAADTAVTDTFLTRSRSPSAGVGRLQRQDGRRTNFLQRNAHPIVRPNADLDGPVVRHVGSCRSGDVGVGDAHFDGMQLVRQRRRSDRNSLVDERHFARRLQPRLDRRESGERAIVVMGPD